MNAVLSLTHLPAQVKLTPRERQVFVHLAQGHGNREIADMLKISVKTVESHGVSVRKKLEARNNSDLTRFAIKAGFIDTDGKELVRESTEPPDPFEGGLACAAPGSI